VPPRLLIAPALLALVPVAAQAAPKTDVLILINGDHITCEIRSLGRDQLVAKTDHIGTITVKWGRVAELSSARVFSVETATGILFVGSLQSAGPGRVTVVSHGGVDVTLQLSEIVGIRSVSTSWFGEVDGNLNFGFSYTRGSGVAQLNVSFAANFRRPKKETSIDFDSMFTRTKDVSESSRSSLRATHYRYLNQRWLWGVTGEGQRNSDLGIKFRGLAGSGMGYRFLRTNHQEFIMVGAAVLNREVPLEGHATSNAELSIGAVYGLYLVSFPKTNIDIDAELLPSLTESGRVRFELNSSVGRELWHDFTVTASLYDSYDNRPPGGSTLTNDVGVALSIGWTF
jgi:Protein of unknown function, DUF481